MILKFRNVLATLRSLPGSSPQGTVLGVILFIIVFNGAALRTSIPRPVWPLFPKMGYDPMPIKLKFVDDLSVAARVNLNKDLKIVDRQKPLAFEERFGTELVEFSDKRKMRIN